MGTTSEELTHLSGVIGLIYEGATDPGRWTKDILPALAEYIQAPKCILFSPFQMPQEGGFGFIHGISQQHMELYVTKYQPEDIHAQAAVDKGLVFEGNVMLDIDLAPRDRVIESRYYKEFLMREDMDKIMTTIVFGPNPDSLKPVVICTFWRGLYDQPYTEQDRARLKLLMPHLSRSLGVMQRIRSAELTMATSLAALDRLPSGVLLVDAAGEVSFANRAAQRMLESGEGLKLRKLTRASGLGRLVADSDLANRALAAVLQSTLNRDPYGTEHFSDSVVVPRSSGEAYALQFSALGRQTEFGAGSAASAIVFLSDGAQQVEVDPILLQSAYGLSAAEARVAIALLECGSANEVAEYLSISPHTVRTQIKASYAKLGVDTRARFVKLMMGLARAQ